VILGSHVITVRRASTTEDDYGNPISDWATASSTTVSGCSVQPLPGLEQTVGRDTVVSRWQLWAPDGTDLTATDRVEWDGNAYDVDGEVQRWDFPPMSHLTALLRRSHS
jgi:head-tail adaptor